MATVPLDFIPPAEPGIVALRIWESPLSDGVFSQIERTTEVGVYPAYITRYTTENATSTSNWFAIQWEDAKGALSELSQSVQGGTETLVNVIVNRVLLRDPQIDENVAAQEAEAVIESYFGTDPYEVDPTDVPYNVLSGLVLLTMARCYLTTVYSASMASAGQKYTAGLISQDAGGGAAAATKSLKDIKALIDAANLVLGRNYSAVLLMEEIATGNGQKQLVAADLSRLIIEIG